MFLALVGALFLRLDLSIFELLIECGFKSFAFLMGNLLPEALAGLEGV